MNLFEGDTIKNIENTKVYRILRICPHFINSTFYSVSLLDIETGIIWITSLDFILEKFKDGTNRFYHLKGV